MHREVWKDSVVGLTIAPNRTGTVSVLIPTPFVAVVALLSPPSPVLVVVNTTVMTTTTTVMSNPVVTTTAAVRVAVLRE